MLLAGCVAPSGGAGVARFEFVERHMGCAARIVLFAEDERTARAAARAGFDAIGRVDAVLSDYRVDSAVERLARMDVGESAGWEPELIDALERAARVSEESGGAFDVTVGPLVRVWREARRGRVLPSAEVIDAARGFVGWERLRVDSRTRAIAGWRKGMRLDFGGIGQGIGADRALAVLRSMGIAQALVDVSGDLAVGDPPPGERGWRVLVMEGEDGARETLMVARCGVTTSGDAEQFVELGGERWSHVIDPRTGWALTRGVRATVVAGDATEADALATAVLVLGVERGIELAERRVGVEARVVERLVGGVVCGETTGYAGLGVRGWW
ncbi:MAG: FAD:protein FMN transferase [Planctomycetes bacterium]|nr:FAD:protein FMN transferase [Planctomycetota bacterium]